MTFWKTFWAFMAALVFVAVLGWIWDNVSVNGLDHQIQIRVGAGAPDSTQDGKYVDLTARFLRHENGKWLYKASNGTVYQMDIPRSHEDDYIRVYSQGSYEGRTILWWPAGSG